MFSNWKSTEGSFSTNLLYMYLHHVQMVDLIFVPTANNRHTDRLLYPLCKARGVIIGNEPVHTYIAYATTCSTLYLASNSKRKPFTAFGEFAIHPVISEPLLRLTDEVTFLT